MTGHEIVSKYLENGYRPVFWKPDGDIKGPTAPGWPTKHYSLADYQDGDRVGLLTGVEISPGRFLHDVDVDWAPGFSDRPIVAPDHFDGVRPQEQTDQPLLLHFP